MELARARRCLGRRHGFASRGETRRLIAKPGARLGDWPAILISLPPTAPMAKRTRAEARQPHAPIAPLPTTPCACWSAAARRWTLGQCIAGAAGNPGRGTVPVGLPAEVLLAPSRRAGRRADGCSRPMPTSAPRAPPSCQSILLTAAAGHRQPFACPGCSMPAAAPGALLPVLKLSACSMAAAAPAIPTSPKRASNGGRGRLRERPCSKAFREIADLLAAREQYYAEQLTPPSDAATKAQGERHAALSRRATTGRLVQPPRTAGRAARTTLPRNSRRWRYGACSSPIPPACTRRWRCTEAAAYSGRLTVSAPRIWPSA
jgi:hypothetical protein